MKDEILNSVKQELLSALDSLTLDNLDSAKEKLATYFEFLESLKNLPMFGSISSMVASPTPDPVTKEVEQSKVTVVPEVKKSYFFDRKLRGGIVQDLDGGYPLPEKLVRDMGLEHGDRVAPTETVYINGSPRTRFEIVEKHTIVEPTARVQLDYCVVESARTFTGFQIKKYTGGEIMVDGQPFTFHLPQKDALDFSVREGDLVDVSYYDNNLDSLKIIWKHDVRNVSQPSIKQQVPVPKKAAEEDVQDERTKYPVDLSLFKDKNLVIVGSEYEKGKYQKACELLSINLTHMSGDEGKVRLRTAIKKADVVVLTTQHVGHRGSVPTAELCKDYDIPFAPVDRNGVQYILLEAEKVIKRKVEQAVS